MPSSQSILLSVDGNLLGGVEKYRVLSKRDGSLDISFSENCGNSIVVGAPIYRVELEKIALCAPLSDGVFLHKVDKSSVSLYKPDRVITYSGCRWVEIEESCDLTSDVMERVVFLATDRVETMLDSVNE